MINLNSLKDVVVIAHGSSLSQPVLVAQKFLQTSKAQEKGSVLVISTDTYTVKDSDSTEDLMETLGPLVKAIDKNYNVAVSRELGRDSTIGVPTEGKTDPKIIFLIDTSNKTGAALARLFQGPWGGFPAAKHTIAADFSTDERSLTELDDARMYLEI